MLQEMWAARSVGTKSFIDNIANQGNQRNVLGAPGSFLRKEKRFLADLVAMRRNKGLNPQTLNGQAHRCVWENQFQCFEENGISGESSAHNILYD
jgi:hypothetical protein